MRLQSYWFALVAHLLATIMVTALLAYLVLVLWYPPPYDTVSNGRQLFYTIAIVNLICGPLLTAFIYKRRKDNKEFISDVSIVIALQLCALGYGLYLTAEARPVYLVYEGSRFRVVHANEIDKNRLSNAPEPYQTLPYSGPKLLAVTLSESSDPDFLQSVMQSLQGYHPAYRPSRWIDYKTTHPAIAQALQPITALIEKNPNADLPEAIADESHGYLPLETNTKKQWVVLVNRTTLSPSHYLPLSGW